MKKYIIILLSALSMILAYSHSYSQSDIAGVGTGHDRVNGYYVGWRTGVGSTTGTLEIKNDFNSDINFFTNGSQKATILAGGNVGIGTTNPTNLLHIWSSGTSTVAYTQWSNGNTTYTSGMTVGVNSANEGVISMQDNRPIDFLTNNTRRGRVTAGGNFLIGDYVNFTTNNQLVQYAGSNSSTYHQFVSNNNYTAATDFFKIGITYNGSSGASDPELISQQVGANMNFYTSPTYTNVYNRMQIGANGNVGIGMTSANNLVQMHGGYLQMTNSLTGSGSGKGLLIGQSSYDVEIKQQEYAHMNFFTNGIQRMQIGAAGNIGIGDVVSTVAQVHIKNDYATTGLIQSLSIYGEDLTDNIEGLHVYLQGDNNVSDASYTSGCQIEVHDGFFNNGVVGKAYDGVAHNFGGYFLADGSSTTYNYGVSGESLNGAVAVGGYFTATGGSSTNYAVYAVAGSSCTGSPYSSGMTGTCSSAAGYFDGAVVTTNDYFKTSDQALKTNVNPITDASNTLNLLQPKSYYYDTVQYNQMNLNGGLHYGLMAQDVEALMPQYVRTFVQPQVEDANGGVLYPEVTYKGLSYDGFVPLLIAGFKEQQQQINDLTSQLAALQNGQKTGSPNTNDKQLEVKLVDQETIVLEQNNPNPFRDNTTISYNIPDDVKQAQILFYNSKGNVISTVEITQKGEGSLMVYGSDLTSGIYTYTLLIDGRVAETKKMVKIK